jgi:hypothetical protein
VRDNGISLKEATEISKALVVTGAELENFDEAMWDIVTKKTQLVFARYCLQVLCCFLRCSDVDDPEHPPNKSCKL